MSDSLFLLRMGPLPVFCSCELHSRGAGVLTDESPAAFPDPPPRPDAKGPPDRLVGRTLGDYRILRVLGRGAMAEVYLAQQVSLQRKVALKILDTEAATEKTDVERFLREARAAASLVHAHIVQVYEVGQSGSLHYIAQEYVEGETLGQRIDRAGPLDPGDFARVLRQVASALARAGEAGIVHRDIKPDNLMLTLDGEVKVADFGLARVIEGRQQPRLTEDGMTMGSPLYMSPEQIEGKPLDARSDIYSLGVTCFQLITGRPPFSADSSMEVALQHLRDEPPRLETLRADFPPVLGQIVERMLAKRPEDRFGGGREVLEALESQLLGSVGGSVSINAPPLLTASGTDSRSRSAAATQKLAAVMATEKTTRPLLRTPLFWSSIAGALLLGVTWGLPANDPFLLVDADDPQTEIRPWNTAELQYEYARKLGTEEAWESVALHFPNDQKHVRLADRGLAEMYLKQDRRNEALETFARFASENPSDSKFHAYGLAGRYIIMVRDGERDLAFQLFAQLWPLRDQLSEFSPQMTRHILLHAKRHNPQLTPEMRQEIERRLNRGRS